MNIETKETLNLAETNSSDKDDSHQGNSVLGTYFNVVCITAGMGILGLPQAVAAGGWLSILFIFLSGIMATFTSYLLIQCLYANPNQRLENYPAIGYEAFGRPGRIIVQFCHYSIILGASTLFIMTPGLTAEPIGTQYGAIMNVRLWILCSGVIVGIPYCLLRTMKEFVWMAIFGFFTTLITLLIVVVLALVDLSKVEYVVPVTESAIWTGIPTALAVFSLSYAGNVIHPHLEGAMKEPKKWPVAAGLGLTTVCLFYLLMTVVAYYVYGNSAQELIFDNLPKNAFTLIARVLITLHVLMTGPILLCSFGVDFEAKFNLTPESLGPVKATLLRIASRAVTVSILTLVAMFVPHFGAFMGIIGSLFNSLNLYIFPILFHIKLFGFRNRHPIEYMVIAMTLLIASITFSYGGYNSILGLRDKILASNSN